MRKKRLCKTEIKARVVNYGNTYVWCVHFRKRLAPQWNNPSTVGKSMDTLEEFQMPGISDTVYISIQTRANLVDNLQLLFIQFILTI